MVKHIRSYIIGALMVFAIQAVSGVGFLERLKEAKEKTGTLLEETKRKVEKLFGKVSPYDQAKQLLTSIEVDLQKLRSIVVKALENGSFNQQELEAALERLKGFTETITFLEQLDEPTRQALQKNADAVIKAYQALQEETAVLELWLRGYDAYEQDLDDNFKHLPSQFVKRPHNKKLYQELGFGSTSEGVRASFNAVRQNYQQQFEKLKKEHEKTFNEDFFRPYLRVLDYVFKTPYSKKQYDAYVKGSAVYVGKIAPLKKYEAVIQKLFIEDLSGLRLITGMIETTIR